MIFGTTRRNHDPKRSPGRIVNRLILITVFVAGCSASHETGSQGFTWEGRLSAQHEFYTLIHPACILPRVPFGAYERWRDAGDVNMEEVQGSNLYFTVTVWQDDRKGDPIVSVKRCVTTIQKQED